MGRTEQEYISEDWKTFGISVCKQPGIWQTAI